MAPSVSVDGFGRQTPALPGVELARLRAARLLETTTVTPKGRYRPGRRSWPGPSPPPPDFSTRTGQSSKISSKDIIVNMQPQFPPDRRRDDPQRNSEAEVDELKSASEASELDFRVWLEGLGWFGLEVKGTR